jgi:hypothetical protein
MGEKKILLSGVFGPFGVDDTWGRKENIMELFHNQVTKAQGLASFRYHHRSFGLYFIAENIDANVTVLDFPSHQRFRQELANNYDIIGLSFIAPNFVKAQEMARLVREISPQSTIIIGGHGAAIEGVEELIDCDHVVHGEGIRWMRDFLGQDPDAAIKHPALPSAERASIMGVPLPGPQGTLLVPGVGCVNGCSFCSTSHFFGKSYTPFLRTGKELFDTCCRLAEERGSQEFFVMDENFLKNKQRALELLHEMERHRRYFTFQIFSSAEAIQAFGIDNLVRLGAMFVWIGVESSSPTGNFAKNQDVDAQTLVRQLRERGIVVLASGILCQEHHRQDTIQREIDFMIQLEADFVQFMLLTPLPVTSLYQSHKERGLLRNDLCYEEWHGQKELSFRHPEFPGNAAEQWVDSAFRQDYEVNSSSMYRVLKTTLMGYRRLSTQTLDPCLKARQEQLERRLRLWARMLPAIIRFPANQTERARALELRREIRRSFGLTLAEKLAEVATPVLATLWELRTKFLGDGLQPRTIVSRYRTEKARFALPATTVPFCPAPRVMVANGE